MKRSGIRMMTALAALLLLSAGCGSKENIEDGQEPDPNEQRPDDGKETGEDPLAFEPDVEYDYDDSYFINPEKGMYLTNVYYFRNGEVPGAASLEYMRSFRKKNMSLSFSQFYLMDFMDKELSPAVLKTIEDDFARHREAGLKTIVRFCYVYTGNEFNADGTPKDPEKEPPMDILLRHIEQVKPLFQTYKDIIYVLQAGFIGSWGEWSISKKNDNDRREVLNALLDALPADRQVQLRTPMFKKRMFSTSYKDTITLAQAFSDAPIARVGGHNDCFLANGNDAGTFNNDEDKIVWRRDSRYTIMGGETCILDKQYCNCENALQQFERYHWSYLNSAYNVNVLNYFDEDGCLDDVYKRLGYRLYLEKAAFDGEWEPGGQIRMRAVMANNGFASIINPRAMELVLVNKADASDRHVLPLDKDPRFWRAGSRNLWEERINLPAGLKAGATYNLYLNLPDPEPTLHDNPEFSIRLANKNMWNEAEG
ncbi:MAG: DUF4832 domain-containing protein, partial [Bacteroidales bacterium]|nr:DUF4832 domain-containing protein [Bacteroidales bacterium]